MNLLNLNLIWDTSLPYVCFFVFVFFFFLGKMSDFDWRFVIPCTSFESVDEHSVRAQPGGRLKDNQDDS